MKCFYLLYFDFLLYLPDMFGLQYFRHHQGLFCNFYASPNIVRVIKWRRVVWVGHMAYLQKMRKVYKISVGRP